VCARWFAIIEVQKLQTHLSLLREEYVKLQRRLVEAEKSYQVAAAGSGDSSNLSGFVARLLKTVADLYAKELYRYKFKCFLFHIKRWDIIVAGNIILALLSVN